jgi:hypothetical protein
VQGPGLRVGTGQQKSDLSMAPDILSYGRRPPLPSDLGRPVVRPRPSCDNQPPPPPPMSSPPGPHHGNTDHQGEGGATLGLLWPLPPTGATTTVHNLPALAPCLAAHGHRPGPPRHRRAGRLPFLYPSSGPWRQIRGWDSGTPWSRCPVRKFFQKIIPGKMALSDGTQGENFNLENLVG